MVDMQKYVQERLQEVPLARGRASQKNEDATQQEKDDTRAAIGAITWAAKEGRPDCAAAASLIARCLNKLKVQDIVDLNKVIREVKSHAEMSIPIEPIQEERMCWGVVTDASWGNAERGASQGAYGVLCYDRSLVDEGKGRTNLLHWKSGKIHRVVSSTLAAEAQALSKGLGELAWTVTVYAELTEPNFDLKDWAQEAKKRRLNALTKESVDAKLKKGLCLVDAKSLFDHLVKETIGSTDDRRTAIEMQVIRQSLEETGTAVKWIPHTKMIVDVMTKRSGNRAPLDELLSKGTLDLTIHTSQVKPTRIVGRCET